MGKETAKEQQNNVPEHLKEHAFKPGESGNPDGRPKGSGVSIVNELEEILAKPSDPTNVDSPAKKTELAHKMIDKAIEEGDNKTIKMIIEQIDGKPTQKTDITSDGKPIFTVPSEIANKNEITSSTEEDS